MDDGFDPVDRPKGYNLDASGVECIELSEHLGFSVGNALKYVWRAEHKGGDEDLRKSLWYVRRELVRRRAAGTASEAEYAWRDPPRVAAFFAGNPPSFRRDAIQSLWNAGYRGRDGVGHLEHAEQLLVTEIERRGGSTATPMATRAVTPAATVAPAVTPEAELDASIRLVWGALRDSLTRTSMLGVSLETVVFFVVRGDVASPPDETPAAAALRRRLREIGPLADGGFAIAVDRATAVNYLRMFAPDLIEHLAQPPDEPGWYHLLVHHRLGVSVTEVDLRNDERVGRAGT